MPQPQVKAGGAGKPPKPPTTQKIGGYESDDSSSDYYSQRTYTFGKQYANTRPNMDLASLWKDK